MVLYVHSLFKEAAFKKLRYVNFSKTKNSFFKIFFANLSYT